MTGHGYVANLHLSCLLNEKSEANFETSNILQWPFTLSPHPPIGTWNIKSLYTICHIWHRLLRFNIRLNNTLINDRKPCALLAPNSTINYSVPYPLWFTIFAIWCSSASRQTKWTLNRNKHGLCSYTLYYVIWCGNSISFLDIGLSRILHLDFPIFSVTWVARKIQTFIMSTWRMWVQVPWPYSNVKCTCTFCGIFKLWL